MKKLCWIVPTRDRIDDLDKFLKSFMKNNTFSDLYVIIDEDDLKSINFATEQKTNGLVNDKVNFVINNIDFDGAFLHILNHYALSFVDRYKYIGFLEDDCVIMTKNFDSYIVDREENVIYLNDKETQPAIYAGIPIIKSEIVKQLGYYSPPELRCLWADCYWKCLGDMTNSIKFLKNVIVKHEHYSFDNNKKQQDAIGKRIEEIGHEDYISWRNNKDKFIS